MESVHCGKKKNVQESNAAYKACYKVIKLISTI